jgi:hypothetical protein
MNKSIEELKAVYGEELVDAKIKEVESQLGGQVIELDEALFMQAGPTIEEPEIPADEEVVQIISVMTHLYLAEGNLLLLLDAQKNKKAKHIPKELRQRLNNLFVNNRVVMDYFHKRFDWDDVSYQNNLANGVETMTNMFVACSQADRDYAVNSFKAYLEEKYVKKEEVTNG